MTNEQKLKLREEYRDLNSYKIRARSKFDILFNAEIDKEFDWFLSKLEHLLDEKEREMLADIHLLVGQILKAQRGELGEVVIPNKYLASRGQGNE